MWTDWTWAYQHIFTCIPHSIEMVLEVDSPKVDNLDNQYPRANAATWSRATGIISWPPWVFNTSATCPILQKFSFESKLEKEIVSHSYYSKYHYEEQLFTNILHSLQIVSHASFVLSKTSLALTKFIEKCTNICNIKQDHYIQHYMYFDSAFIDIVDVNIFFLSTWSNLDKFDLGQN
jgi:hypothetical protein